MSAQSEAEAFAAGYRAAMKKALPRFVADGPPRIWYSYYDGHLGQKGRVRHVEHPMRLATDHDLDTEIAAAWTAHLERAP